ncbi:DUF2213 domain-containing protein [Acetobacter sp. TBRC 12305]|uniref:DUF2213 domain-containing protein n=1 Tax=Acetobacter garciniae TaxID=2817435 RepID=A0A939HQ16_9PROT|nr:DUF2213 domain-containing protein [Acetobacter garciniae]MBO1325354.1 DUF2213 domain-containing protein [Acetobacter garciniae]MBX0345474.1 DUF2213 domain-containing protein [Acetobacter garciniae]
MTEKLGYDRVGSVRVTDEDGRLFVASTPISKATVNPYYGREIPNAGALGLEPDRLYQLLRDPQELAAAAPTFNAIPVLMDHVHVTADEPRKDIVAGATGTDAVFDDPYLRNSLTVWDADAIARINSGEQRELSCAYRYVPVMEPGTYQGQRYDGRMTQIRGNHVALVPTGRAGPDVLVADSKPNGVKKMRTAGQMLARLSAAIASGKLAMDASEEDVKKCMDEDSSGVPESATQADDEDDEKDKPKAKDKGAKDKGARDESEEERERDEAAGGRKANEEEEGERKEKKKLEAEDEDDEKDDKDRKANDAAIQSAVSAAIQAERKRNADANEARSLVRPLVGDVIGMDSAPDILRYALKERGVDATGVNLPGLKALVQAQIGSLHHTPAIAVDAAPGKDSVVAGVAAPRKL